MLSMSKNIRHQWKNRNYKRERNSRTYNSTSEEKLHGGDLKQMELTKDSIKIDGHNGNKQWK